MLDVCLVGMSAENANHHCDHLSACERVIGTDFVFMTCHNAVVDSAVETLILPAVFCRSIRKALKSMIVVM